MILPELWAGRRSTLEKGAARAQNWASAYRHHEPLMVRSFALAEPPCYTQSPGWWSANPSTRCEVAKAWGVRALLRIPPCGSASPLCTIPTPAPHSTPSLSGAVRQRRCRGRTGKMADLNYRVLFHYRLLAQSGSFADDLFAPVSPEAPRMVVQEDLCIGCGACEEICPATAIRL